jgi:hypothetical protein
MVERDGTNVVMEHVGLDNAMEKGSSDESKFTINGCCGTTDVVPAFTSVVGKSWVSVLEISDGNCRC